MQKRLQLLLTRLWQRLNRGSSERRTLAARARFWDEVRKGQREAESRGRP
jgi:hypothetical protein